MDGVVPMRSPVSSPESLCTREVEVERVLADRER
jgi:hypothetical protein